MPKSAQYELYGLNLLLNAVPIPNVAANAISGALSYLYVALHSSQPSPTGDQTSNELNYNGYTRAQVLRSPTSPVWTFSGNTPVVANPTAPIVFSTCLGGPFQTVEYFSIGQLLAGTGTIYYYGAVSPNLTLSYGLTPVLTTSTFISET